MKNLILPFLVALLLGVGACDDSTINPKDDKKDGKPDQPKQDQQPKPQGGIPKERLQNLLEAVNNEEKKIQDKVNAKKVKARPVETEKDW